MGDTGLETVGGGIGGRWVACLLHFDALKLGGVCSEWNLEWNLERL
jgi:hypothetical protein